MPHQGGETPSLPSDAFEKIEGMLSLNGGLPEGAKLPSERDLTAELGISRRALRQILAHFEDEGLIVRRQGAGTIVVRHLSRQDDDALKLKKLTSPRELMEARQVLEPAIARLAAVNATNQDLEEIKTYLEQGANSRDAEGWERWDSAFHRAISHATHNALIGALFETLHAARFHTEWGQLRKTTLDSERRKIYTTQHRSLLLALKHRDSDGAADAMRQHLKTVKQTLFDA